MLASLLEGLAQLGMERQGGRTRKVYLALRSGSDGRFARMGAPIGSARARASLYIFSFSIIFENFLIIKTHI
jgi:hypothetical protein